jgi:hypothetical protein
MARKTEIKIMLWMPDEGDWSYITEIKLTPTAWLEMIPAMKARIGHDWYLVRVLRNGQEVSPATRAAATVYEAQFVHERYLGLFAQTLRPSA